MAPKTQPSGGALASLEAQLQTTTNNPNKKNAATWIENAYLRMYGNDAEIDSAAIRKLADSLMPTEKDRLAVSKKYLEMKDGKLVDAKRIISSLQSKADNHGLLVIVADAVQKPVKERPLKVEPKLAFIWSNYEIEDKLTSKGCRVNTLELPKDFFSEAGPNIDLGNSYTFLEEKRVVDFLELQKIKPKKETAMMVVVRESTKQLSWETEGLMEDADMVNMTLTLRKTGTDKLQ